MKKVLLLVTMLAIVTLALAGCNEVQMSPRYRTVVEQAAILAEVNAADAALMDPNNVKSEDFVGIQEYLQKNAKTWRLFIDAVEGKESE